MFYLGWRGLKFEGARLWIFLESSDASVLHTPGVIERSFGIVYGSNGFGLSLTLRLQEHCNFTSPAQLLIDSNIKFIVIEKWFWIMSLPQQIILHFPRFTVRGHLTSPVNWKQLNSWCYDVENSLMKYWKMVLLNNFLCLLMQFPTSQDVARVVHSTFRKYWPLYFCHVLLCFSLNLKWTKLRFFWHRPT